MPKELFVVLFFTRHVDYHKVTLSTSETGLANFAIFLIENT